MTMINRVNDPSVVVPDIDAEDLVGSEWAEWYRMTATERWRENGKLWESFLALGARLILNPILRVLFSMRAPRVRALLMGGHACISYGAADFRRTSISPFSRARKICR